MSQGTICRDKTHQDAWRVGNRKCNYSAFNGYRRTPSEYSEVVCTIDGRRWRTKAAYADTLPDLEPAGPSAPATSTPGEPA